MSRISGATKSEDSSPIPGIFYTSQSDAVRLGGRIGTGAEGEVYEIQDQSDLVAKLYHEPPPPEKADKLVVLSRLGNERLFNLSTWPVTTLRKEPDGEVVGFVMRKISHAEEVHALHSPKSRLQKFPEASWAFLIYVAANIARAVAAIHEYSLVIGDVNPKNILVTRRATVSLLDVDSFQVTFDGKTYRCEGGFPEYTPPELQGVAFRDVDRTQEHDRFGLAVVIFQLLFLGRHPYSGLYLGAGEMPLEKAIREFRFAYGKDAESREMRQPPATLALDSMPSLIVRLFRQAFLTTDRPGAREWTERLDELAKALKKCDKHSGHYYYRELDDCPWCGIETHAQVRLFNFSFSGDDTRRGHFRLDEAWKEIVNVQTPDSSLIRWEKVLKPTWPSEEVMAYERNRRARFIIALLFSIAVGLLLPIVLDLTPAFLLLILSGLAACAFAARGFEYAQSFFLRLQPSPDAPLPEKVQARLQQAEEETWRLQLHFDREAGNEQWEVKRDELRNRKETYEKLAEIRRFRLQRLEAEARKNQLDEFLDQFKINDADFNGVGPSLKSVLLSHGVETAADLSEDMTKIPSVGYTRAKRLLEWRRDLEKKFAFDPSKGVPYEARIQIDRDVDALRLRLETELSEGARILRNIKHEIETRQEKLRPTLLQARQELVQAETDMSFASKRDSAWLIITALIIASFFGLLLNLSNNSSVENIRRNNPRDQIPPAIVPPALSSEPKHGVSADLETTQKAFKIYQEGVGLLEQNQFATAAVAFQNVTALNPNFSGAYEGLSYALLRMKKYDESAEASKAAIKLSPAFAPYYYLGLAQYARGNWAEAIVSLQYSVELRDTSHWKDEYTDAYYYLGLSLAKTKEIYMKIQSLEADAGYLDVPINRFKLAIFYLCAGQPKLAKDQYRLLKNADPALAKEFEKLMKKHGKTV
ncbi:MAG: hypothetical protein J2P21_01895 [Chloracidobacterium sp.]|nr:hypothetical protein [Chloracidobacterium sp.]